MTIVDALKEIVTTLGGTYAASDDTVSELLDKINAAFESGGGGGSGLPAVTTDDNGKLLGVTGGEWGKVDAPTGDTEVRVQFALTVDGQTGAMSATTDADLAETCSAVSAGKLVWGDVIVNGDGVESHYRGIINADVAESGTGNRITVSVIDSVNNGLNLGVYRIKWDANGCIPTRYTLTTT